VSAARPDIFIAPMDWGLGHATRCVPLIRRLLASGCRIFLGGSGSSGAWLKREFPALPYTELPAYDVQYSSFLPMPLQMLRKTPSILRTISSEHDFILRRVKDNPVDCIISDNRYGLYHPDVHSVFITHQLQIQGGSAGFLEPLLLRTHLGYISRFRECWIPDLPDAPNLGGRLSHVDKLPEYARYIGPLSRFSEAKNDGSKFRYELACILSGPEPYRTALEKELADQLYANTCSAIVVRGTEAARVIDFPDRITVVDIADTAQLENIIKDSKYLLSRSGYSSVMDWTALQKQAILIPTPGQTEQEYLARYLREEGYFYSAGQQEFRIADALPLVSQYSPPVHSGKELLEDAVKQLLYRLG